MSVLREKGYDAYYFYGGNSYFDNMETFFGGNGYRIIDQKSYKPEEITFANIWGVCDEDAYDKVIRSLGERADTTAAPFFAHVMTVSNHRPYTYPAGRIPIPNDAKLRSGGVMTAIAPFCPIEVSDATPIANGNTVPPKSPIIIKPDTSFFLPGR